MKNYYFMNVYTGELDTPENAIKRYYSGERYAPGSESRTPSPLDSWLDEWHETNNEAPADNLSARDIKNLFAAFAVGLFYCAPVIIRDGLDTFGAILRGEELSEWEL